MGALSGGYGVIVLVAVAIVLSVGIAVTMAEDVMIEGFEYGSIDEFKKVWQVAAVARGGLADTLQE